MSKFTQTYSNTHACKHKITMTMLDIRISRIHRATTTMNSNYCFISAFTFTTFPAFLRSFLCVSHKFWTNASTCYVFCVCFSFPPWKYIWVAPLQLNWRQTNNPLCLSRKHRPASQRFTSDTQQWHSLSPDSTVWVFPGCFQNSNFHSSQ